MSRYSIWLILEQDSRARYRDLIKRLSKKLKTPAFDPHCTIYGRLNMDLEKIRSEVMELSIRKNQFSATVKSIKIGKTKWKSLYLALDNNEDLSYLYGVCKNKFSTKRIYAFDPHLSLAYGIFDPESIHYSTKHIIIPKYLAFSGIAVVKTGEDISDWEIVFQRQFGSSTIN